MSREDNLRRLQDLGFGEGYGEDSAFDVFLSSSEKEDPYDRDLPLAIETAKRSCSGDGITVFLRILDPGILGIEVEVNDEPRVPLPSLCLEVPITLKVETNDPSRTSTFRLYAQGRNGESHGPFQMVFQTYPVSHYNQSGRFSAGHSRIHLTQSDLSFQKTRPHDWILSKPSDEDRKFARNRWGNAVVSGKTTSEKAMLLAGSLIRELETCRGTPSDVMDTLAPFAMYERLINGLDRCWCANIASIFSHAANALDIPARCILMRHQMLPPPPAGKGGSEFLFAGGHTVNEVYCRESKRWMVLDLNSRCVGVSLGTTGPLHLQELSRFWNDPLWRNQLVFALADPERGSVYRLSSSEIPFRDSMDNFLKQGQKFLYLKAPSGEGSVDPGPSQPT